MIKLILIIHDFMAIVKIGVVSVDRYKRGLETGPQANLHQSGREYFHLFFQRLRATSMTHRRVENTRVHFGANSPLSVNV